MQTLNGFSYELYLSNEAETKNIIYIIQESMQCFFERFASVRPATNFTCDLYTAIRSKSQKLLRQLAVSKINVR